MNKESTNSKGLTNSEQLENIVDKIFLLNHNIVSEMITASQDEEYKRYPGLNKELEDKAIEKLSSYFAELRRVLRDSLRITDELVSAEIPSEVSEEAKREALIQSREEYKDKLVDAIEARLRTMFISMNFVPVGATIDGETTEVPTYYNGKPEEFVRAQEYQTLMDSVFKQMEIIFFEDNFAKQNTTGLDEVLSPYIVPTLLDAIGDKAAFAKAEEDCEKFITNSNSQAEVYDEFPELRDTVEQVEFLRIQNRYKRRFEEAAGHLNSNTSYGDYFFDLYKKGILPLMTGFSQDEIRSRINDRVKDYSERNKEIIQEMFLSSTKKYKKFRRKRSMDETANYIKFRVSGISKKILGKKKKDKKHRLSEDAKPVTAKTKKKTKSTEKKKSSEETTRPKGGEEK